MLEPQNKLSLRAKWQSYDKFSTSHIDDNDEAEEEEEAVFIRDSVENEHLPNAHQAQQRPKPRARCVRSLSTCLTYSGAVVFVKIIAEANLGLASADSRSMANMLEFEGRSS